MSELIYYVAVSVDGYIAGPDGDFSGFPVEGDHMEYLLQQFPDAIPTDIAAGMGVDQSAGRFSAVVMGWNTYAVGADLGVLSPYRHLDQTVFSRRERPAPDGVRIVAEDPVQAVRDLKASTSGDIWLCGGGNLAGQLITEIDRVILKRNPVLFGAGIPLFDPSGYTPVGLDLVGNRTFDSGVAVTEYTIAR